MAEVTVRNNPAASRYEAMIDGERAGFAAYQRGTDRVVFTHTRIDPAFEGRGVGSVLARSALDDVIASGMTITPLCPFIAAYIKRHPEYLVHVDAEHQAALR
jgi:uncharacterized protein